MGLLTRFHRFWKGDKPSLVIEREQDVEPILEANKRAMNEAGNRQHQYAKGDMYRVASIPNIIIEKWMKEGINVYNRSDWPKVRQKLNDPEYAYLRTRPGRI